VLRPRALVVPTANKPHRECTAITPVAQWIRPSLGRLISLALQVRHFRCSNRACPRKTFAEPLPNFLFPYAQRTFRLRESLRKLGEETGGEAGARHSRAARDDV
jgi:hypothetical protein